MRSRQVGSARAAQDRALRQPRRCGSIAAASHAELFAQPQSVNAEVANQAVEQKPFEGHASRSRGRRPSNGRASRRRGLEIFCLTTNRRCAPCKNCVRPWRSIDKVCPPGPPKCRAASRPCPARNSPAKWRHGARLDQLARHVDAAIARLETAKKEARRRRCRKQDARLSRSPQASRPGNALPAGRSVHQTLKEKHAEMSIKEFHTGLKQLSSARRSNSCPAPHRDTPGLSMPSLMRKCCIITRDAGR